MPRDRGFISGIHNYCDRWCERCEFPLRCRVYHDTEKLRARHVAKGEDPDTPAAAIEDVSRSLSKVHRLLARLARREGLNVSDLADVPDDDERSERQADADPIMTAAWDYMTGCRDLLEKLRPAFDEACDDIRRRAGFMDVNGDAEGLKRIRDSYEVLCWDHTLIPVKIRRALEGLVSSRRGHEEAREFHASDAAGSAAVARRSLRRSQAALLAVYEWDEQLRDAVIGLLAVGQRLLQSLEKAVPGCITFQWPPPEAEAEQYD